MKFSKMSEVTRAVDDLRKEKTGRNMHYPVLFKKALCEFIGSSGISYTAVAKATGIPNSGVHRWYQQFQEGLFKMDAAYSVSHKSKSLNGKILEKLKQSADAIQEKIDLIEKAEILGMKIIE